MGRAVLGQTSKVIQRVWYRVPTTLVDLLLAIKLKAVCALFWISLWPRGGGEVLWVSRGQCHSPFTAAQEIFQSLSFLLSGPTLGWKSQRTLPNVDQKKNIYICAQYSCDWLCDRGARVPHWAGRLFHSYASVTPLPQPPTLPGLLALLSVQYLIMAFSSSVLLLPCAHFN